MYICFTKDVALASRFYLTSFERITQLHSDLSDENFPWEGILRFVEELEVNIGWPSLDTHQDKVDMVPRFQHIKLNYPQRNNPCLPYRLSHTTYVYTATYHALPSQRIFK